MEWREQSAVSCDQAYLEAQRWIEAVTKKTFGSDDFRSALENGVLLCDLINKIRPGIIKKVNRLPTPIAWLDNINVFLKACVKLGLKEAQLFHPGDLQDLSSRVTVKHQETNRRLKNVLITIYWLGRRAHYEHHYNGPYLNFKAFEGLLGTALYKALQDLSGQKGSNVRDSGFGDNWYSEQEELYQLKEGGGGHRRDDSLDSLDSLGSQAYSGSSDVTLKGSSEGCCSDTEADSGFRMADSKDSLSYRRSVVITPKVSTQYNQFLPSKDKASGYVPAPLRKKRAERNEDSRRSWANPMYAEDEGKLTSDTRLSSDCYDKSQGTPTALPEDHQLWSYEYESGSESDADRPDPDLVLDDLASRRFHSPSPATPTNFAVPISPMAGGKMVGGQRDPWPRVIMSPTVVPQQSVTYLSGGVYGGERQPTQQGCVRVDHRKAVCTDSLFRDVYDDSEDEDDEVGYADPVQDDLYTRKMGIKPQTVYYDKFLPKFWTPEEAVHVQKIKLGSQKRPWYKKMQGFSYKKSGSSSDDSDSDISPRLSSGSCQSSHSASHSHTPEAATHTTRVVGKRQQQMRDGIEGSKSTSDIQVEPSVVRQVSMSELLRHREQIKQSEDQWQDDLSKWKNRRRSVNSDIVKKKEEREKIEQMTYGSNTKSKTFKEMQEEREIKRQSSVGSRLGSRFSHLDEDVFEKPVTSPRSRAPPARSYTIDTPYHASELPEPSKKEDKSPAAPLGRSRAAPPPTSDISDHPPTSTGSVHKQPQRTLMEPKPPAVSRVSASLPRTYQASDSARLTSVVTPRPFGAQPSRITSLPRTFAMDESKRRVNGDSDVSKNSSVPNRYHQFMTSEDEAHSQSSSAHSSEDEEEQEETAGKNVLSAQSISPGPPRAEKEASVPPAPVQTTGQESSCQMRISLNQRPNSSRDFGFQATWDSTGAHVTSIQEGSPAEMFRLQTGDEVLTVNGHQVAKMSYTDWKAHMAEALLEGSLVMDIRRHGKNNWDRDQPSLPFKSHKIINLTSMDHPILIGFQDSKASLDLTSHVSMETPPSLKAPAHPVTDMTSNGVNGGFREESVTMRSKDSEPISLKNLKRRSEFFETGGSESAMPDIPVPSIAPSTSRWSWDPEEERRRQEKWLREQERLLQEKYKRDQEKLQEEWLKAQQEIAKSPDHQELEVNNNHRSLSLLSTINQSAPTLWEEEEKKREEEEQQKQRQQQEEEERRMLEEEELRWQKKREEEQRRRQAELEQQRLREEEEERKRQAEMEEQRRREQERRRRQEEMVEQRRREEEMEEQRRRQRALEEQQQWSAGSLFLANKQPVQSFADREKSKSSPQLDEQEKPQRKGVFMRPGSMAHWLLEEQMKSARDKEARSQRAASELERERRNILNAMKYREPERASVGGAGDKKGQPSLTQAETERQQIINEMKKKNQLLTDSSWIRQRSASTAVSKEEDTPPMRRGDSLDNLDTFGNSWRSSWTPRSNQNYSRSHSALSGSTSFYGGWSGVRSNSSTLPSSSSAGSLRGRAGTPSSPWSRQSSSLSPSSLSPTTSPEPASDPGEPQQRSRSVSGKKICTFCDTPLGKGAAMIIESLGLCYHLNCFKCIDCKTTLGGSEAGAEVRIRNKQLYCNSCYMRFKTGQPTSM